MTETEILQDISLTQLEIKEYQNQIKELKKQISKIETEYIGSKLHIDNLKEKLRYLKIQKNEL